MSSESTVLSLILALLRLAEHTPALISSILAAAHEPDPEQALRDLLATVGTRDHVAETHDAIEAAARAAADAAPDSDDDGGEG